MDAVGPIPASLTLSMIAAGFVALVVPTTGGVGTVVFASLVICLLAALFGAGCATLASTRRGAVGIGALTGFLVAGWSWVMGLSTLVAVWASAELFAMDAQGRLLDDANGAMLQHSTTIYYCMAVAWLVIGGAATAIGAVCGGVVGPMANAAHPRILPATTPIVLSGVFWVLAVANAEGVNSILAELTLSARILPIAMSFLAPAVLLAWAVFGIGTRLKHAQQRVRVLGWLSAALMVGVVVVSGLLGSILIPLWTLPLAVGLPCAGMFVGGLASVVLSTGDEALPKWSDALTEGVMAGSAATVLSVGPLGLSATIAMAYLLVPAFNGLTGFDDAVVPEVADRITGLRVFLLWFVVGGLVFSVVQIGVALVGVGLHRWLVKGDSSGRLTPMGGAVSDLEASDDLNVGPFQPPRGL